MNLLNAPRQPFVGLAIAAGTGIIVADFVPVPSFQLLFLFGAALCLLLIWPNSILVYTIVGLGFFWIHSFQQSESPGLRLVARLGNEGKAVNVFGVVTSEPKAAASGMASFLLRLTSLDVDGHEESSNATILVRWRGRAQFGDELKLFGIVDAVAGPRNPGEFDMRSYLARRDIRRVLVARYPEDGQVVRHGGGNPILRAAQTSRRWMQATLCRSLEASPDVQEFISGITLGLRHQTPEDIEEPFQQTGTLHLFAVAGLHVGIVARLLWMLATVAQLSRRTAAALIIPLVLFYSAVTGLHISSVRAAIMCSVLLGGLFFERKVFALNSLAAAAFFLLCWDTNEIFSTGFQLSFAVVAAILLLAEPFFRAMRRLAHHDPFLPRNLLSPPRRLADTGWRWVCRGASVSLAAWVGSLPLIGWYFYLVSPISLFANLVVVPLAFFVLAIGLLSILSAPLFSSVSIIFNNANWVLAKLVLGIVHLLAQTPGGHHYFELPHAEPGLVAKLTVLDVGAGGLAHLRANQKDWLLDCGSERDYERILRQYLHFRGLNRLDGLLLTHGDALHIGAAVRLVDDLPPAIFVDNPAPDRSLVHQRVRTELARRSIRPKVPAATDNFAISNEVSLRVLYPGRNVARSARANADDEVVVVQVTVAPSTKILFMSDSGYEMEASLLSRGIDLRSDILIKGQHHSGQSGSGALLEKVSPQLIVATSRDFPAHQRIDEAWASRVRQQGIKLFRQDETGAVELRFTRGGWQARAYTTGEILRSSSR